VSMVQPVIILNALFCVIWSFCMLVSETTGVQMVLAYSIVGTIRDLCVANRVSFCFHDVGLKLSRVLSWCGAICS